MKILHIGLYDQIGGIETFVMNYYRHIDRKKIQFDFIDMHNGIAFNDEIKELGGKIYNVPTAKHPLQQYREIKQIIHDHHYDLVHVHMLSAANIIPVLAAKSAEAKIIVHSHNSGTPRGLLRKILHKVNQRKIIRKADTLWACSKQAGKWFFGDKAKFTVIPNAIDADKFKFDPQSRKTIRKKLNISKDAIVIGHVGRFEEQKNHTFLIDVFKEVHDKEPRAILLLIGDGELRPKIEQKVKNLDLEKSVIFLGRKTDVSKYYSAMDIFILPSLFEGLPIVAMEAAANRLPCLLSSEVTRETSSPKTKYININSTNSWCQHILSLSQENNNRANSLQDKYKISTQADQLEHKYLEIYNNIKKTKVLHITGGLAFGGVEAFIYNYFSHLERSKYDLTIVSHEKPNPECQKRFEELGFKVYHVPSKHENAVGNILQLHNIIKKVKPEIIHCHLSLSNYIPLLIAKSCGVKHRISHSHLAYPNKTLTRKICCRLTKHYATDYVGCGETASEYLYGESNYLIIRNAIEFEKFKYNKSERGKIRHDLGINQKTILYGNIGRMHYQKNQLFLLDIFQHIHRIQPASKLLILGNGELQKEIFAKVKNLNLADSVIILNSTAHVYKYYNAMDVFLLPSLYEGFCMALIEAQINDLTCFISDTVAQESKLTKKTHFISLSKTAEEWAKTITKAPIGQRQISDEQDPVLSKYNIDIAAKTLEIYYNSIQESENAK